MAPLLSSAVVASLSDLLPVKLALAFPVHTALAAFLLAALVYICMGEQKALPPGPPAPNSIAGFFLGHVAGGMITGVDVHRTLLKWANQYGSVYRLRIAHQMAVVLVEPSLVATLLMRSGLNLPKAAQIYKNMASVLSQHGRNNLFTEPRESEYWKAVRKTMAPCFSPEAIRRAFVPALRMATALADGLEIESAKSGGKASIHLDDWVLAATLDTIGVAGFGVEFNALADKVSASSKENEFLEAIHLSMRELHQRALDPMRLVIQKLLPFLPANREILSNVRKGQDMYTKLFKTLKSRGEPVPEDHTIGAALMRLKDPVTGELMDDPSVISNVGNFLIGGFDTGGNTIIWALYDIASNPEVQRRVALELQEAGLLHVKGGPAARPIEFADLSQGLPYLSAVLKESSRCHTVAASGIVRQSDGPVSLGGYDFKKGTLFWVPLLALHNYKGNWDEPERFKPERWMQQDEKLGDGGRTLVGSSGAQSKVFIPFSTGPRDCVGMAFGNMDVKTIMLSLLTRFWFEVDVDKMGTPEDVLASEVMALVLVCGKGLHLHLRPHTAPEAN